MWTRYALLAIPVLLLTAFAPRAQAETYRDEKRHFTIDLPSNWQVMSSSEVNQINRLTGGRLLGMGVTFDSGLRCKGTQPGTYPYVLIQTQKGPPNGTSFEEIEQQLSHDLSAPVQEAKQRLGDLIRDVSLSQPVFDRKTMCVVLRTRTNVMGIGVVQGLSIGHLGKDQVVFVHAYAKEAEFPGCLSKFETINDYVSFDRGYEFTPGTGSAGGASLSSATISTLVGGFIALTVIVGGYLYHQPARLRTGLVIGKESEQKGT